MKNILISLFLCALTISAFGESQKTSEIKIQKQIDFLTQGIEIRNVEMIESTFSDSI